jgi:hypothetical protein
MGRKPSTSGVILTAPRAARLYRLLSVLGDGAQTRRVLLLRMKVDVRGFYRDLELLRELRIDIALGEDNRYSLPISLDECLARLPFPDPGLSVRDVLQLCNGSTAAHRKLKQSVASVLQPTKPR